MHAVIGTGSEERIGELLAAVAARDAARAVAALDAALAGGADPGGVLEQLLGGPARLPSGERGLWRATMLDRLGGAGRRRGGHRPRASARPRSWPCCRSSTSRSRGCGPAAMRRCWPRWQWFDWRSSKTWKPRSRRDRSGVGPQPRRRAGCSSPRSGRRRARPRARQPPPRPNAQKKTTADLTGQRGARRSERAAPSRQPVDDPAWPVATGGARGAGGRSGSHRRRGHWNVAMSRRPGCRFSGDGLLLRLARCPDGHAATAALERPVLRRPDAAAAIGQLLKRRARRHSPARHGCAPRPRRRRAAVASQSALVRGRHRASLRGPRPHAVRCRDS